MYPFSTLGLADDASPEEINARAEALLAATAANDGLGRAQIEDAWARLKTERDRARARLLYRDWEGVALTETFVEMAGGRPRRPLSVERLAALIREA